MLPKLLGKQLNNDREEKKALQMKHRDETNNGRRDIYVLNKPIVLCGCGVPFCDIFLQPHQGSNFGLETVRTIPEQARERKKVK